ncbi:hypothetical protein B0H10DRAFT_1787539, partial [Mycena sp. CBHHK59/15]
GTKRSWAEALELVQQLGFDGVKDSGLTTLQFANNLVLLGICRPPTADEMAIWISENPKLGAFKALKALGFNLAENDLLLTRIAFRVVYDHFENFLIPADKLLLGFGAIFVEHVLCKITRWQDRYDTQMNGLTFIELAEKLQDSSPWIMAENVTNKEHFPFPLELRIEQVQKMIVSVMVSGFPTHGIVTEPFNQGMHH